MKEKKYHIDLHEGEDMVAEPKPTHRVSVMEHAVPMPMSGFENHKEVLDEINLIDTFNHLINYVLRKS